MTYLYWGWPDPREISLFPCEHFFLSLSTSLPCPHRVICNGFEYWHHTTNTITWTTEMKCSNMMHNETLEDIITNDTNGKQIEALPVSVVMIKHQIESFHNPLVFKVKHSWLDTMLSGDGRSYKWNINGKIVSANYIQFVTTSTVGPAVAC